MRGSSARAAALGGMLAALAIVIMCLGGLIPVATYVCPLLCMLLAQVVLGICGRRIAWAWYACTAFLSLLLGPDKEAAGVFLVLGYYPIVKPYLDRLRLGFLWKLLLFNGASAMLYGILLHLLGLAEIAGEFQELGQFGLLIMLALGNLTFLLTDKLLSRLAGRFR